MMRSGIWSEDEHDRFLHAIKQHPNGPWTAIADAVGTRSVRQVQTHTQKYYEKIMRRMRSFRKERKTWARLEHRIEDDILEFCRIMHSARTGSSTSTSNNNNGNGNGNGGEIGVFFGVGNDASSSSMDIDALGSPGGRAGAGGNIGRLSRFSRRSAGLVGSRHAGTNSSSSSNHNSNNNSSDSRLDASASKSECGSPSAANAHKTRPASPIDELADDVLVKLEQEIDLDASGFDSGDDLDQLPSLEESLDFFIASLARDANADFDML